MFSNKMFVVVMFVSAMLQSSTANKIHIVGDSLGWVIPPGGPTTYSTWAASQTFLVGDVLVFQFADGIHDATEVTKADFDACNVNSPILTIKTSPAKIVLNTTGDHHYICSSLGHCDAGQKLLINVRAKVSNSPPPSVSPHHAPTHRNKSKHASHPLAPPPHPHPLAPPPHPHPLAPPPKLTSLSPVYAPTPTPASSPVTYIVGDTAGWGIPPTTTAYQTWATGKSFNVGDVLVFNYKYGSHDVAEVTKDTYSSCNVTTTLSHSTEPPTKITLTTSGQHFFLCTIPSHCNLGQQLAINVDGDGSNSASPSPGPTSGRDSATGKSYGNSASGIGVGLLTTTLLISLVMTLVMS